MYIFIVSDRLQTSNYKNTGIYMKYIVLFINITMMSVVNVGGQLPNPDCV